MRRIAFAMLLVSFLCSRQWAASVRAGDANRLTYLDESDPYYVSREFARLTTPQWIGEPGVEAVVVLAIDDMREVAKYESYLRPILERLKKIDGRAGLSIMTCRMEPSHPHLQKWLKEGLSIEVHTYDHPCPLLKDGDFAKAKATYDVCVDLLNQIPGAKPLAFRMPCCDSLNTVSPRFYSEIFNQRTPGGAFLSIDTSVFQVFTSNDPALPRHLTQDADGREKFKKYTPVDRGFVNTIFNYPYPYVIGKRCWEFPCVAPSDWSAQHRQKPFNPQTVADWKAALDATVIKRGVFNLVFHPHGWIRNGQIIELIDHCVEKHPGKVKFLSFREAHDRLTKNLLAGQPLRDASGGDNGARLLDVNNDGYLDAVIGNDQFQTTRVWAPAEGRWRETPTPVKLVAARTSGGAKQTLETGVRFGVLHEDGSAVMLVNNGPTRGGWRFSGGQWIADDSLLAGLELNGQPLLTSTDGADRGVRLRDVDADGVCELISGAAGRQVVFVYDTAKRRWNRLRYSLPEGVVIVDGKGRDAGLRFVDLDDDGDSDVLFSNETRYVVSLFESPEKGWSKTIRSGKPGDADAVPMVTRNGTNNGAWFHSRSLWVQNEDTARLPNLVDHRTFNDLLGDTETGPLPPQSGLRSLKARDGFEVELVAAEPLVQDPVAFDWGLDGRLWVVEMADYPLGVDGHGKHGGRVRFLEDSNGDGKYDRSTVFLEGLGFPTGVMSYRKGVLVSCARRSSMPKTPTATARPMSKELCTPVSARATSNTASMVSRWDSTTGSTAPTAIAAAESNRRKAGKSLTWANAICAFDPTWGCWNP